MSSRINVLVTGGTGSIGSVVVKGLLDRNDTGIIYVLGRTEGRHERLRKILWGHKNFPRLIQVVGDVRDYHTVLGIINQCDTVVHTAAMKYVPECEENVWEAIQTNLIGARNVRNACMERNVSRLVAVSTDKAANPKGVMGMTKRLQEKMFLSEKIPYVDACVVRFGNVLGSEGSVVWKFKDQISKGEKVTITDVGMQRFVMSLKEAAEFIFWAMNDCPSNALAVKKMRAAGILDIAGAVAGCLNKQWNFEVVGNRGGEKVSEDLFDESETNVQVIDTKIGTVGIVCDREVEGSRSELPGEFSISKNLVLLDGVVPMLKESGVV